MVARVLYARQAILNFMRHSIGSQCNCFSRVNKFVFRRLEPHTTTRAAAFCARWRRAMFVDDTPNSTELEGRAKEGKQRGGEGKENISSEI